MALKPSSRDRWKLEESNDTVIKLEHDNCIILENNGRRQI